MAWTNLSFETAGTNPGEADGWVATESSTVWEFAKYVVLSTPIYYGWEPFDYMWSGNEGSRYAFIPADLEVAEYAVAAPPDVEYEGFEEAWSSNEDDQTSFAVTDLDAATYYAGLGLDVETFGNPITASPPDPANWIGTEWGGNDEKQAFNDAVDLSPAMYDAGAVAHEDFENGWYSNENDQSGFTPGDTDPASYGEEYGTTNDFENFEAVFPECAFVVNPVTDVLTLAEVHAFPVNTPVHVRNIGGILPDPLSPTITYYVKTSTPPNDLTVSTSPGGAAVDVVDDGVGEHLFAPDGAWYWLLSLD